MEKQQDEERRAKLKAAIEQGSKPYVVMSRFSPDGDYCMGDLEALGWARRCVEASRDGDIHEIDWLYTGPHPIVTLHGPCAPNDYAGTTHQLP